MSNFILYHYARRRYLLYPIKKAISEAIQNALWAKIFFTGITELQRIFDIIDKDMEWQKLSLCYPILDDVVDRDSFIYNSIPSDVKISILNLYKNHVKEWGIVQNLLSKGILN